MEALKLMALLCCTYCYASDNSHVIPVEGYETELENLGQHVEYPETPVKIIKITKTIAVKVPVPYPVKVIEKVPYPVHIAKPYPVPVQQIIKVPHIVHTKSDNAEHDSGKADSGGYGGFHGSQLGGHENSYQVQEAPAHESAHFGPESQSFNGYNSGHEQNFNDDSSEGSIGNSHGDAPSNYYGYSGNDGKESTESKSYDDAIKGYLEKLQLGGGNNDASKGYHYH